MDWFYVENGQQAGPVDDTQLQSLISNGKIGGATLVWHEGMDGWKPYRELTQAEPGKLRLKPTGGDSTSQSPTADHAPCAECGREFLRSEMISYQNVWVCGPCKQVFFQRIKEGGTVPVSVDGLPSEETLLTRDYDLRIGECISRGWQIYKTHPGKIIGGAWSVGILLMLVSLVPVIGNLLQLAVSGPLMGGYYYLVLCALRSGNPEYGDLFVPAKTKFVRLMLVHIVNGALTWICLIPAAIGFFVLFFMTGMSKHPDKLSHIFQVNPIYLGIFGITCLLSFGFACYFSTAWSFALPLAVDRDIGVWKALQLSFKVVKKHWFKVFFLFLVAGLLVGITGALLLIIGLIFTLPLFMPIVASAYEKVFCDS